MGAYAAQDILILLQVDAVIGILDHEELCIRHTRRNELRVCCEPS